MENNVQTLKNDVPTLKKAGYITEVVTPKTLNNNISIAKYVTQVGVASKIKFEDAEEGDNVSGGTNDGGSNDTPNADTTPKEPVVEDTTPKEPVVEDTTPKEPVVADTTPKVDAPKEPVVEEPTKTPEEPTTTPEDEIVVDEQEPVEK